MGVLGTESMQELGDGEPPLAVMAEGRRPLHPRTSVAVALDGGVDALPGMEPPPPLDLHLHETEGETVPASPRLTYESHPVSHALYRKGMHGLHDIGYPRIEHHELVPRDPALEPLPPDSDALSPFADSFAPAGTPFAYSILNVHDPMRAATEGVARKLARLRREIVMLHESVLVQIDSAPLPAPASVVRVVHPYASIQPDELDLVVGTDIVVLNIFEDDWALGLQPGTGRKGAFPLPCTVRFDDEVMLAHINAVQSQLEALSQRMESNARAKSLPKASRHKLSPGEELIAQLRAFAHVGGAKRGINTHIGIPSKPPTRASPEQRHGQMDGISASAGITYDLFYTKPLQDAAGSPSVDLTILDFRVTALEASIGSSLMRTLPPAPKLSNSSTSVKSRLPSTSISSSPLSLPPSMPPKTSTPHLLQTLQESTSHLQRLLHTLQTTEKDPPDIDPIQFSMQNLLDLRADLRATPITQLKPKDTWQIVTTPSRRARQKQALPPQTPASLRIAKLHETLAPLDRPLQGLPALLARLETLAPLHTRAAQTSDAVAGVRGAHAHSREGMDGVLGVLGEVEAGLAANADLCRRNWEALEGRVKGLQARLDAVSYLAEK